MEQSDLLRFVVGVLESMKLEYLITGSLATVFYGEPRFTNDVDIVVALSRDRVAEFCGRFPPPDFYVSLDAAQTAVREHSQFNIIHPDSALKVDVLIPADSPFNRSRFSRRLRHKPDPVDQSFEAAFSSPEDVIVKKMEYYREGGSEKHLRDIAGVLKVSGDRVDREYIGHWAVQLGLNDIWQAVLRSTDTAG